MANKELEALRGNTVLPPSQSDQDSSSNAASRVYDKKLLAAKERVKALTRKQKVTHHML